MRKRQVFLVVVASWAWRRANAGAAQSLHPHPQESTWESGWDNLYKPAVIYE